MENKAFQDVEVKENGNELKVVTVTALEAETDAENNVVEKRWYHIDMEMLPAKVMFFFDAAKRQGTVPFMVAFFISLGLKKSEAGFIVGFRVLGSIVGGPLWGVIADKKHAHRILFLILIVGSSIVLCSQTALSLPFTSNELNRCPSLSNNVALNQTLNSTTTVTNNGDVDAVKRRKLFFLLLGVNIVGFFFEGSIPPFIDFAVLRKMQLNKMNNIHYSRQRITSPLGAAAGILLSNVLIAYFPQVNFTCFAAIYILYSMWSFLTLVCSVYLYRGKSFSSQATEVSNPTRKLSMQQTLKQTCLKFDVIMLLITTLIIGSLYAVYRAYTFIFLRQMNASSLLLTLAMAIPYIGSIPLLYFEKNINKLFGGSWNVITFAFFMFAVRFLAMSYIQNPWYALPIEALHPLTAPLYLTSAMRKIKEISPPRILTTMVTIYNLLVFTFGNIAGSSIGGVIYEEIGGRSLYRTSACAAAVWFLVLIVYIICYRRVSLARATSS